MTFKFYIFLQNVNYFHVPNLSCFHVQFSSTTLLLLFHTAEAQLDAKLTFSWWCHNGNNWNKSLW